MAVILKIMEWSNIFGRCPSLKRHEVCFTRFMWFLFLPYARKENKYEAKLVLVFQFSISILHQHQKKNGSEETKQRTAQKQICPFWLGWLCVWHIRSVCHLCGYEATESLKIERKFPATAEKTKAIYFLYTPIVINPLCAMLNALFYTHTHVCVCVFSFSFSL